MKRLFYIFFPCAVFLIDQFTKILVRKEFVLFESKRILPFMDFTYITNTGTAFGLLKNQNLFFILLTVIVIGCLVVLKKKIFDSTLISFFSYGLILGGAFGNLADRIVFGHVTDFIDFRFWPVFNMADTFISIGIGLFAYESFFGGKNESNPAGARPV